MTIDTYAWNVGHNSSFEPEANKRRIKNAALAALVAMFIHCSVEMKSDDLVTSRSVMVVVLAAERKLFTVPGPTLAKKEFTLLHIALEHLRPSTRLVCFNIYIESLFFTAIFGTV